MEPEDWVERCDWHIRHMTKAYFLMAFRILLNVFIRHVHTASSILHTINNDLKMIEA